jgi:hypothetical protein
MTVVATTITTYRKKGEPAGISGEDRSVHPGRSLQPAAGSDAIVPEDGDDGFRPVAARTAAPARTWSRARASAPGLQPLGGMLDTALRVSMQVLHIDRATTAASDAVWTFVSRITKN